MVEEMRADIVGGPSVPPPAPLGKRILAAVIDLIVIPIFIGLIAGFMLLAAPDWLRVISLILLNVVWMTVKDLLWEGAAPGKKMAGIKVVNIESGEKISIAQALIRNVLLYIPYVLFLGYLLETIMLFVKKERLGDLWAKTRVIAVS